MSFYNAKTLEFESFYKELIEIEEIQEELIDTYGLELSQIIFNKFREGISHKNIEGDFEDSIYDYIENNAEVIDTLTCEGGSGEFPIDIYNFGPIYWVSAQEFDPIKYFDSYEDAVSCAESEYEI
jgi:hypothetical protein